MVSKLLRLPQVLDAIGESRSNLYLKIKAGTFPPGVSLGLRSKAWPDYEVQAIIAARIASKTDDHIRLLVKTLLAERQQFA